MRDYARQIARQLAKLDVDVVFSPQSPNSQPIAYLDCSQPIVTWTDAPWAAVVDFYPEYSSKLVCAETLRDALMNEKAALSRVQLAIVLFKLGRATRDTFLRSRSCKGSGDPPRPRPR